MNGADAREALAFARDLARAAGGIALSHWKHVKASLKADRTVVTEADRAVEAHVRAALAARFPGDGYIGEETDLPTDRTRERIWAIDPIDGTAAFVSGLPIWGVSIGLLERGEPALGAVYLPAVDELYAGGAGLGASLGDTGISARPPGEPGPEQFLCIPSNAHKRYRFTFPGKIRSLGSVAAHICYVARGSALGALLRAYLWDLVGGFAVLAAAGGEYRYLSGRPVALLDLLDRRQTQEPILCAPKGEVERLRSYVARIG